MTPAAHVRIVLAMHAERGTPFDRAWTAAMRSLPKGVCNDSRREIAEWKRALNAPKVKARFREAYVQQAERPLVAA